LLLLAAVAVLPACAPPQVISYHGRSFQPISPEARAEAIPKARKTPETRYSENINDDALKLFSEGYELIGFSQHISPLAPALNTTNAKATGKARGAELAVSVEPITASFRQHYFLTTYWRSVDPQDFLLGAYIDEPSAQLLARIGCENQFAYIAAVVPDTPAAQAGLQRGDIIWTVNGQRITRGLELDQLLVERAGNEISMELVRQQQFVQQTVVLNPLNPDGPFDAPPASDKSPELGLSVDEVEFDKAERERYDMKTGFFVSAVQDQLPGCDADLRGGDMVLEVNGKPVKSLKSFSKLTDDDEPAELLIRRGEAVFTTSLPPPRKRAPRLSLLESTYGTPWRYTQPSDWTALAASLAMAQTLLDAAADYTAAQAEIERERRARYYREAQAMAAARPRVIEGRGKQLWALDERGYYVQVSRETVAAMGSNPGSSIRAGRSGRGVLYSESGERINTMPKSTAPTYKGKIRPVLGNPDDYTQALIAAGMTTVEMSTALTESLDQYAGRTSCAADPLCTRGGADQVDLGRYGDYDFGTPKPWEY